MATPITREEAIELFQQMFEEKLAIIQQESDSGESESEDDSDDSDDSYDSDDSETDEEDIPEWVTAPTLEEANKKIKCDVCGRNLLYKNIEAHKKTKTCKNAINKNT